MHTAPQPTAGLIFTCLLIEMKDHPASLRVTCDQQVKSEVIVGFLNYMGIYILNSYV